MKRCSRKLQRKKSMKRNRQKRRTRRIRLTKKYKAGGWPRNPFAWYQERQRNILEEQLDLTHLFNKINSYENLDWLMDLKFTEGKCISDGQWKPGFVLVPMKDSEFSCLKISHQKYDQYNLLENIWEFFRLKQKILKLELYQQVFQPTDEEELYLYTQIQVIVEKFVKLHEAHKRHWQFLKYISEKIPENLEHLYLEDIYQKKGLEDLSKIHNLLLKINQILPDEFRLKTGELGVYDKINHYVPDDLLEAIEKGKYIGRIYGEEHAY